MGRSGPGILDLLSSIGLRAPYTKLASDWKASEDAPVKEFYDIKIPNLCELHFTKSNDEILHGTVTHSAAVALFQEYEPRIWSRAINRPWLFNPGEVTKHAPYTRKLYFDAPEDNVFLKEKVCEIVIERIFRHHKIYIQGTRASSRDGSWVSIRSPPTTRRGRPSMSGSIADAVCFSTGLGLAGHQDATVLQEQGVWLGDYSEEKEAVNGPSFDDISRDYCFQTDAGKRKAYDEPHAFDEAPETTEEFLLCAGCQSGALLKVECHGFEWEDEDNDTVMSKNVWMYPCDLAGRKVFALIKKMAVTPTGTIVWGFWRVDGGYTSNLLLASRLRVTAVGSLVHHSPRQNTPSKRPSDEVIYARQAKAAKQNHASQQTCVVRSGVPLAIDDSASTTSSVPSLIPRDWAPINAAHLERQNHLRATASPDAFGNLPLRSSTSEADQDAPPRPSLVDATAGSVNEEENLYEATPRPERRAIQSGFFRPFARMPVHDTSVPPSHQPREHPDQIQQEQRLCADITDRLQRDSPAIRQESTPAADRETAHAPSHRFRYFITVSWTPGQNIVMLDDTMDVQLVYTRVQRTLRRKLEGRDVGSLSFFIQDEEPIDVEIDDGDAWETVVDMLKDAGLFAVKGAVLRSD